MFRLRARWTSIWMGIYLLGMACGTGEERGSNLFPLQEQLHQQIATSTRQASSYQKTVSNLGQSPAEEEQATYDPIPWLDSTEASPTRSLLHQELSYAWESYFSDPELIDQFEVQRNGDSLIAIREAAYENSPGLASQTWVILEPDSIVLYYASRQQQASWLYANDISLTIQFDSSGTYLHHQLDILSQVPLLKQNISARIVGQNQYSP
ncbi:MAG: hypothetical protein AAF399_21045 [Bacteroidota bacterium]